MLGFRSVGQLSQQQIAALLLPPAKATLALHQKGLAHRE